MPPEVTTNSKYGAQARPRKAGSPNARLRSQRQRWRRLHPKNEPLQPQAGEKEAMQAQGAPQAGCSDLSASPSPRHVLSWTGRSVASWA